jgi:hypothetical protein
VKKRYTWRCGAYLTVCACLQAYLRNEWLSCIPQWARHYRLAYHGGIDTNNHMESLNRAIKSYLKQRLDTRLDSLLTMWVEEIEPRYARNYILDNARSSM